MAGPESIETPIGEWFYRWDGVPRPFVHPVTTPAGHVLSVDAPDDHWWHHALWFTIKFVNGENFWEEYEDFGLLVQAVAPSIEELPGGTVKATSSIEWHRPDSDEAVIHETVTMTFRYLHHRRTDAADTTGSNTITGHAMDWDVQLVPTCDVTLDRTPFTTWGGYGGLTFRGRPDWHDTELRLPEGDPRARVLGDSGAWCALEGPLGGEGADAIVGLAMFDHPENPNHPIPWYASTKADTYGDEGWSNFMNAAFLWHGPLELREQETLRVRHRVLAYDGSRNVDQINEDHDRWLEEAPS